VLDDEEGEVLGGVCGDGKAGVAAKEGGVAAAEESRGGIGGQGLVREEARDIAGARGELRERARDSRVLLLVEIGDPREIIADLAAGRAHAERRAAGSALQEAGEDAVLCEKDGVGRIRVPADEAGAAEGDQLPARVRDPWVDAALEQAVEQALVVNAQGNACALELEDTGDRTRRGKKVGHARLKALTSGRINGGSRLNTDLASNLIGPMCEDLSGT
jgi:hypothetical protein